MSATLGLEALAHGPAPVELYEFTQGTSAWRYASGDQSVTFRGHVYTPREIVRREIRHTQEATSGMLELTLPRADTLALLFVGYLPPSPVLVKLYRAQRQDLQFYVAFSGRVASVQFDGPLATVRCASLEESLQRSCPALLYQTQCNWILFGTGCGLDADDWEDTATVTAVDGLTLEIALPIIPEDGYYRAGRVRSAAGESRFVTGHAGSVLTLNAPFRSIAVGQAVSLWPGCQHTEADCREKFDNLTRHLGFPRMPTRNPFTGTI